MNTESSTFIPAGANDEPRLRRAQAPIWFFMVFLATLFLGYVYLEDHSGGFNGQVYGPYRSIEDLQAYQPVVIVGSLERGRGVYETVCALCHNTDGLGKPNQAPPFAGSEWVEGSPNRLIRIPLAGLSGPLQVKGQEWNLAMPAMGAALSDEDLAAVLSYMRQSWGNRASEITADQVKAVRAEVGNRTQPWSSDELKAIP